MRSRSSLRPCLREGWNRRREKKECGQGEASSGAHHIKAAIVGVRTPLVKRLTEDYTGPAATPA
jgi:hypothetical protein